MPSAVRLYAIQARKAPFAVIFRRGPSRQVLLVGWNTSDDTFEQGQWFKGRIYERRCDLSPAGDLLLYFAASFKKPYYSWTAISRPPFLTALTMWPKGDAWGGGGHFVSSSAIHLNHREDEMKLADGFAQPGWLKVRPFGSRPGWGEDDPIWSTRLVREGWTLTSYPDRTKDDFGNKVWLEFSPPIAWHKPHPLVPKECRLEVAVLGLNERDGPWYMTEHSVIHSGGNTERLGRTDWADWMPNGDLAFSERGCLFRVPFRRKRLAPVEAAIELADFASLRFEPRKAPESATSWPKRGLPFRYT